MKKTARKSNPKAEAKPAKAATKPRPKPRTVETENLGLDDIRELINLIAEKQFTEFELERGEFRMRLGRGSITKDVTESAAHLALSSEAASAVRAGEVPTAATPAPAAPDENLYVITSPIVGTFYRAASPAAEAFVNVGDLITTGKTLCIIEAMKLMNEIQADVGGSVAKIFVENGQPVEFGQPLFGIKV